VPKTGPLPPAEPCPKSRAPRDRGQRARPSEAAHRSVALPVTLGLSAAAAALASIAAAPDMRGALGAGLACIMLAIAAIDARRFIIPNELVAAGFVLGLVHAGLVGSPDVIAGVALATLRGTILAAVFLAIRIGYRRLRGRDGIGLGDVKLAAVAGVWLDWQTIPLAIEIAALSALAFYVLRQWTLGRALRATARLPLGLFLAPAIWLGWMLEITLLSSL
jgi:leader peptidase (prepilin peptidase)/N-methyltransferase